MDTAGMAARLADMLDDPSAFAPGTAQVDTIRATYAPARIGAQYRAALQGEDGP
jgi:hypothetical protein